MKFLKAYLWIAGCALFISICISLWTPRTSPHEVEYAPQYSTSLAIPKWRGGNGVLLVPLGMGSTTGIEYEYFRIRTVLQVGTPECILISDGISYRWEPVYFHGRGRCFISDGQNAGAVPVR